MFDKGVGKLDLMYTDT